MFFESCIYIVTQLYQNNLIPFNNDVFFISSLHSIIEYSEIEHL